MKRFWIAMVIGATGAALAKPMPTRRMPVVTKALGSRYKLPSPTALSGVQVRSARDVADFVRLQQRHFPGAVVTSGFYDWRTTSRYRSRAGLHLGYDIAMPYGTPFSAGWAGRVVAITPWSGAEVGITVQAADGTSVTYGHVSARVPVGQSVLPGDVLGVIASDHVDVKMRDAAGNYLDFGGNGRVLAAPQWALPVLSREAVMANWLLARDSSELAQEELRAETLESEKRRVESGQLRQRVSALEESGRLMKEYVAQGLVSRLTVEENREELERARQELARQEKLHKNGPARLASLKRAAGAASERLAQARKLAAERGVSWAQVETFVQTSIANDKALSRNVESYKRNAQQQNAVRLADLKQKLSQSQATLKSYEELFEMGGISQVELEEARRKHQILEAQLKALQGS